MSTALLADPFGLFIEHSPKHDLEGFWWTTMWTTVNCEGPYGQLVDWEDGRERKYRREVVMFSRPSTCWARPMASLRNGFQNITYDEILQERISRLGHWRYFKTLVNPFWWDPAILDGMEEMFKIFMPVELLADDLQPPPKGHSFVPPLAVNDEAVHVTHDRMIEIVERILKNMRDENPPSLEVVESARCRYEKKLQHDLTTDDGVRDFPPKTSEDVERSLESGKLRREPHSDGATFSVFSAKDKGGVTIHGRNYGDLPRPAAFAEYQAHTSPTTESERRRVSDLKPLARTSTADNVRETKRQRSMAPPKDSFLNPILSLPPLNRTSSSQVTNPILYPLLPPSARIRQGMSTSVVGLLAQVLEDPEQEAMEHHGA